MVEIVPSIPCKGENIMPKKQQSSSQQAMCPNCGMTSEKWAGDGYKLGSQRYCCQGCAEQTGCTCAEDKRATA
jgi:hypothetical protein